MDDPRALPPIPRLTAPRPPARPGQRQQQGQRRDERSDQGQDPASAEPAAIVAPTAEEIAGAERRQALIAALDRLRTTGASRSAEIATLRLWRGRREYQEQADARLREPPPSP